MGVGMREETVMLCRSQTDRTSSALKGVSADMRIIILWVRALIEREKGHWLINFRLEVRSRLLLINARAYLTAFLHPAVFQLSNSSSIHHDVPKVFTRAHGPLPARSMGVLAAVPLVPGGARPGA